MGNEFNKKTLEITQDFSVINEDSINYYYYFEEFEKFENI